MDEQMEINKLIELLKFKNKELLIPLKEIEKENKQQIMIDKQKNKTKKRIEEKKKVIKNLFLNTENEKEIKESSLQKLIKERNTSPKIEEEKKNENIKLTMNYSTNKQKKYKSIFDIENNENYISPIKLRNNFLNENFNFSSNKFPNYTSEKNTYSNFLNFKKNNILNESLNKNNSKGNDNTSLKNKRNNFSDSNSIRNDYYSFNSKLKTEKINNKSNYYFSFNEKKPKYKTINFDYENNSRKNIFKHKRNNPIFSYEKEINNNKRNKKEFDMIYNIIMPVNPMNDILNHKVNYLYGNDENEI
jgi:hypothetical protein